jgi:hypothetical protein
MQNLTHIDRQEAKLRGKKILKKSTNELQNESKKSAEKEVEASKKQSASSK